MKPAPALEKQVPDSHVQGEQRVIPDQWDEPALSDKMEAPTVRIPTSLMYSRVALLVKSTDEYLNPAYDAKWTLQLEVTSHEEMTNLQCTGTCSQGNYGL